MSEQKRSLVLVTIFDAGPDECPRCGGAHVTEGHTRGISGKAYPCWVCDHDNCAVAVAWRRETKPCGIDGCANEYEVEEAIQNV